MSVLARDSVHLRVVSCSARLLVLTIWLEKKKSLTYEAYDATDKGVEVTTVSCHDGFLLGQESFPRRLHHVHGHLADENLHTRTQETQQEEQI